MKPSLRNASGFPPEKERHPLRFRGIRPIPGFSLLEILIAMFLLATVLFGLLWMQRHSHFSSMDAYYEGIALTLAREPIVLFQGLGYDWLKDYSAGKTVGALHPLIRHCPPGKWFPLSQASPGWYPSEVADFERCVEVEGPVETEGLKAFRVRVDVSPLAHSQVDAWLSRTLITQECLVFERRP